MRQAAAEADDHHEIARLQPALCLQIAEGDRNRRARRVGALFQVHEEARLGNPHLVGGRLDDASVRLVRHDPLDVLQRDARLLDQPLDHLGQGLDGKGVDLLALHLDDGRGAPGHVVAGVGIRAAAVARHNVLPPAAIRPQARVENAALHVLGQFQQGGAGAVAEQDAGVAVGPVGEARQHFGADHQRPPREPAEHHALGDRQAVDVAGTGGRDVEGHRIDRPDFLLNQAGRRRTADEIGSGRREDDQVDRRRIGARALQGLARGGRAQVGSGLAGCGNMAPADARVRADPLVGRVHMHLTGQLVVRQATLGKRSPHRTDNNAF